MEVLVFSINLLGCGLQNLTNCITRSTKYLHIVILATIDVAYRRIINHDSDNMRNFATELEQKVRLLTENLIITYN